MKQLMSEKQWQDAIAAVFIDETTEIEHRELIASSWLAGDYEYYVQFAKERNLQPIALLVASLLDTESLLLINRAGTLRFTLAECAKLIIFMEKRICLDELITPQVSHKPVDNQHKPVDNSIISVDNLLTV